MVNVATASVFLVIGFINIKFPGNATSTVVLLKSQLQFNTTLLALGYNIEDTVAVAMVLGMKWENGGKGS